MALFSVGRGAALTGDVASTDKIRSIDEAVVWRATAAPPVVFTNGVFDLFHAGHVQLLEQARALGSTLVVALNSDASVRTLGKGSARPLVAGTDRAMVVAALACVDCVVMFDEPTPLRVIEALQPDVLVKGADYALADVVGADVVRARGGHVAVLPLLPGRSTTSILERLRASS